MSKENMKKKAASKENRWGRYNHIQGIETHRRKNISN